MEAIFAIKDWRREDFAGGFCACLRWSGCDNAGDVQTSHADKHNGGNLLLNIGPQPDGELPAAALSRMKEIGDWIAVNGEAIHGTRPIAPYKHGNVCLTRKGRNVYAIYLAPEGQDASPLSIALPPLPLAKGATVRVFGVKKPLLFRADGADITVELPAAVIQSPPCRHAFVLKTTLAADKFAATSSSK